MEPVRLWAAVEFTARSGSTEALLTAAARAGLHLYGVTALPGGFCGHCAARQYPRLGCSGPQIPGTAAVRKKQGLYFRVRPLLRRAGLWPGWRCSCRFCSGRSSSSGLLTSPLSPPDRLRGVCHPARGGPAARLCRDRSKARRRGIRPAAQR